MLYLKKANFDDIEKEYLFVRDIPEDENGFINEWHGVSRDDFEQGGFARPVDTDKPDFIFIVYVEGHVFKQSFAGKRFIDIRSVEQQHL